VSLRVLPLTFLLLLTLPMAAIAGEAGSVTFLSGEAWILRADQKIVLQQGDPVLSGDVVITGSAGRVKLTMADKSQIYISKKSRIVVADYEMGSSGLLKARFKMLWGKVRFIVSKLVAPNASFEVHTKAAVLGVRGTEFAILVPPPSPLPFGFESFLPQGYQLPDVTVTAMLFEGKIVGIAPDGSEYVIPPGYLGEFMPDGSVKVIPIGGVKFNQSVTTPSGKTVRIDPNNLLPPKNQLLPQPTTPTPTPTQEIYLN